jgi:hypothetical protein
MADKGDTTPSPFNETESIITQYSNTIEKVLEQNNHKTEDGYTYVYFWVVKFSDGKYISQYDENGNEVLYNEVLEYQKKNTVTNAWFIPLDTSMKAHGISLTSGQKLIIRRRRVQPWCDIVKGTEKLLKSIKQVIYLLGYEETIRGEVRKTVLHINEVGESIMNNDFNYNFVIKREVPVKDFEHIKSLKDLKAKVTKDGKMYSEYVANG